jgi:quinol monooxygenase YgiN
MVRAVLTMVAREGCEYDFEKIWRAGALQANAFPGCIRQALTRDQRHKRTYIITGDWADLESLESFEKSLERQALSRALEPLRESARKSVLDIIACF